ncbi:MAG TPA: DUF2460 domain-containing protein [Pyrinomonadaceae bacterium]|nr:DUF2460 domain-containing protein [Pyrinomonadaceae bacterium]
MSQPFYEIRFPLKVSRGAEVRRRSRTEIRTGRNGFQRRGKRWANQLREWDAARGIQSPEDLRLVMEFQDCMDGAHAAFRFQDFSDYEAADEQLDTSAGGSVFQLRKASRVLDDEGNVVVTKWRQIIKPVVGTLTLALNGLSVQLVSVSSGFNAPLFGEALFGEGESYDTPLATCDYTTGLVTLLNPAGLTEEDELLASFQFDVPACFGSDEISARFDVENDMWEWGSILIQEVRL